MPTDLSEMVNPVRIRRSVKRLFDNTAREILSELLQNSQRAGAKNFEFRSQNGGFTVTDDGTGIDGVEGFHSLLKLAESDFENPDVQDQDPMGLGIHALLAHPKVKRVTFVSKDTMLSLETERWWNDQDYCESWYSLLTSSEHYIPGFQIIATCEDEFTQECLKAFENKSYYYEFGVGQGYEDLLAVSVDGKAVGTKEPDWTKPKEVLVETTYEGCPLVIGHENRRENRSYINWYGQLIELTTKVFSFHLTVRQGRPINPLSPSRKGVIQDDKLKALTDEVHRLIFQWAKENESSLTPEQIGQLYAYDREYATKHLDVLVARRYLSLAEIYDNGIDSFHDMDKASLTYEVFGYDNAPTFLEDVLYVPGRELNGEVKGWEGRAYGMCSLLTPEDSYYYPVYADEKRIQKVAAYWKTTIPIRSGYTLSEDTTFTLPGEIGFSSDDQEPTEWKPVDEDAVVLCFDDCNSYDVRDSDLVAYAKDRAEFLSEYARLLFCESDDWEAGNGESQRDSYDESTNEWVRQMLGASVKRNFTIYDLQPHMADKNSPIDTVKYFYGEDETWAIGIEVTNKAGETKTLKIYG